MPDLLEDLLAYFLCADENQCPWCGTALDEEGRCPLCGGDSADEDKDR